MGGEISYILMTSSGSYDDYRTHILGVYSGKELAEEGKIKYTEALNKFFDINQCPVDEKTREKIESYEIKIDANGENTQIDLYHDWYFRTIGVFEMSRDTWIIEKMTDQIDLKVIDDKSIGIKKKADRKICFFLFFYFFTGILTLPVTLSIVGIIQSVFILNTVSSRGANTISFIA